MNTKTYPPLTDSSKCSFGKHKGSTWGEVPIEYLEWLWAQDWFQHGEYADIKAYIVSKKSDANDDVPMSYPTAKPDPQPEPGVFNPDVSNKALGELFYRLCKNVLPLEACIAMVQQGIIDQQNMAVFARLEPVILVGLMVRIR